MRSKRLVFSLLAALLAMFLPACIHEYPMPVAGQPSKPGVDPTTLDTYLQVTYNLVWDNLIHHIDFNTETKAQDKPDYRFVVEVILQDSLVCHDVMTMKAEEFSLGQLRHRISSPLKPELYQIAVWFEIQTDNGDYFFDSEQLSRVAHLDETTTSAASLECGYATDILDLTGISPKEENSFMKELELTHVGAKFEIIATDVQEFITQNKEALLQGEEYRTHLKFSWPLSQCFNLYGNNYVIDEVSYLEFSGRMRLPYAEYDELKIAEGFLFCRGDDIANFSLRVTDTSLATVAKTSEFSIPIKRGFITRVSGDFLTGSLGSSFSIDNVWEGEIRIDI